MARVTSMNRQGAVMAAVMLLAALPVAARAADKPLYGDWGFDLTAMDPSVTPGVDFDRYANGGWLARTTIPADKAGTSLRALMSDRIEARLHALMEQAAGATPSQPPTLSDKVGAFYAAFMDERR